jgi:predicted Zn-dependent peptidase
MFKKTTLKNGLRIITIPQKSTQAATVLVLVGTGSKYETKEINGISHFLEHLFFKGTKKRPTPLAISETLDRVGGIYNAFTGEEYTGYFAKVAASHFDLALDWVSDIFLNSALLEKDIKKEKGVIIEEINMLFDHPMSYVQVLWPKLLYGNQPAGWSVAGSKKNIIRMKRQDLLDYRKKQYVAENTIICIAGNIDPRQTLNKVKKYFSKISTTKFLEKPKVIEKQAGPTCLLYPKKTDQTHLCLGVRAYNIFHPQRYTLELLEIILGGMMSSRLFIELRDKLGIAYYVRTSAEADPDAGYLVTQAGIDNKNVKKAISSILKEYKKISQNTVPKNELKKAKDCIKGKTALLLESSDAQASFIAGQELLEKKILTLKEIFKKIDKISQSDILKVAKDIFQPQKLNLVLIGPFKDKERFQKLLKL